MRDFKQVYLFFILKFLFDVVLLFIQACFKLFLL